MEKTFNFAIVSKTIPTIDLVIGIEAGLRQVRDPAAIHSAGLKVAKNLKETKSPTKNLTQEEEGLKEITKRRRS